MAQAAVLPHDFPACRIANMGASIVHGDIVIIIQDIEASQACKP